ncbi:MAG: FecR family protein [Thermoanaerobaculia bacterium]|nr:FecR family protein [Thermoanaerobaculia bacterium]
MTDSRWNSEDDRRTEEEVRRLIEAAGSRPEIPAADLAEIQANAEIAWRQSVERARLGGERGRGAAARSLLPLIAATLVAALVLAWWLWPRAIVLPKVAEAERLFGDVQVEAIGEGQSFVPVTKGQILVARSRLRTGSSQGDGSGAALRLASGASLRLGADTELELVASNRIRLTAGAVYFDSGRAASAGPTATREALIWIETSLGVVRDVGTQFSVRMVSGERVEVRVREGEVQLGAMGAASESDEVVEAGRELLLSRNGEPERRNLQTFGEPWEWVLDRAPEFPTAGKSVDEFLVWFSRETGLEVHYDNDVTPEYRRAVLRGSTHQQDPAKAAVVALAGANLRGEIKDGYYVVSIATR